MVQLDDILSAFGGVRGHLSGQVHASQFDGFAFDSRSLQPGELFFAIRSGRGDGHDFLADALARGATGMIVEKEPDHNLTELYPVTCIVVDDTRLALKEWGSYILAKYRPKVIAVTGSVGKTNTQNAIRAVLSHAYSDDPSIFANENYNDLFGLPIALSRLLPTHELAILELASDSFGELEALAAMVSPHVAVVTNVYPVHLEYLRDLDHLTAEYAALVRSVAKEGYSLLNADDPRVRAMATLSPAAVLTFSMEDPAADFYAQNVEVTESKISFVLCSPIGRHPVSLSLLGKHHVYSALAASAVAAVNGLGLEEISNSLSSLRSLPGRLNVLPGRNGVRLVDDTFSSSPASVNAALDALALFPNRRIALLGDMLGLGDYEREAHEMLGRRATELDCLITRGDKAAVVSHVARSCGMPADRVFSVYSQEDTETVLSRLLQPGDVVLIKGSEETRMERVVEHLLDEHVSQQDCLVRQDAGSKQVVALHRERPTWLEIDLGAIAHNVRRAKEIVGEGVDVLAVLKADAYGHGASRVAHTALLHGASILGTACLSEAVALRHRGIVAPILILGYTPPWQARDVLRYDLSVTVYSLEVCRQLSRSATLQGGRARVHIKVDTGMGRLGLMAEEVAKFAQTVLDLPNIEVEGIFTHLATADSTDLGYAREQLERFDRILSELSASGVTPRYIHAANSAASLGLPEARYNLVRLGIALYGLNPSDAVRCPPDFRPALSFKTQIAQIKDLAEGSPISYGCTFRTERPSRIAVIPVGYGDGFRRGPRNAGIVLVRGQRARIVGVVCMDMCMIDVTDVQGVRVGDEVVLIGEQQGERISVEDLAERMGTINYEIISQILPRVPREVH